jgi:hypothetical protein
MKVFKKVLQISNNNNLLIDISQKANIKAFQNSNKYFHTFSTKSYPFNSLNKNNSFYFISKKNIWDIIKETFSRPKQEKFQEKKNKKEKYYLPDEQLVFEDKKYLLVESSKSFTDAINFMQNFVLYPIMAVCSYFFFKALIKFNIISLLFSSFFSYTFFRINFGINTNKKHIIIKMQLLDNGRECEIKTLERSFVTDIKYIRRLQVEEGLYLAKNIKNMRKNYIPLSIDTRLYLIPLVSTVQNQEILSAISNGKYIKTEGQIVIEKSIDIFSDENYKH